MASLSDLQSGSVIGISSSNRYNYNTAVSRDVDSTNTTVNGTLPYLYHHPQHGGHHHGGPINLVGVLVGILLPHAVCTLFVLARAGSRAFLLRKWFLDDSLVVVAWLCSTAVSVVYSMSAILSNRNNNDDDSDGNNTLDAYLLRTYLGLIFYQLCLILTKLSILALYLRMFAAVSASEASSSSAAAAATAAASSSSSTILRRRHHHRHHHHNLRERRLAWLTVAVVIAYGIPLLWMSIMQCYPPFSSPSFFGKPVAVCFSFTPLLVASASLHTATDAWLILLVVPFVLTRLRFLPRSQRWALAAVLSLSVFVIAASLTRLQLSLHANYRPSVSSSSSSSSSASSQNSPTGPSQANTLGFFVMTILECDIALICASAPMLRPLLARLAPRLGFGDDGGGNGSGSFDRAAGRNSGRGSGGISGGNRNSGAGRNRRSLFHPRGGAPFRHDHDNDDDSEDLTSVVSYHGYPWTRASSPARSRSRSRSRGGGGKADVAHERESHADTAPLTESSGSKTAIASLQEAGAKKHLDGPSVPSPVFSKLGGVVGAALHRTPTDLSLRSLPRSLPPRSLPPRSRDGVGSSSGHGSPLSGGGVLTRRPSSVFFFENSDYYDQYFTSTASRAATPGATPGSNGGNGGNGGGGGGGTKKAGVPGAGIGLGILLLPHGSQRNGSQESFVMGLNDPASPTRPTRLTGVSGYSGETYTEEDGGGGVAGGGDDLGEVKKDKDEDGYGEDDGYELKPLAPNKTETSFLDDDTDSDDQEHGGAAGGSPGHPTSPSNGARSGKTR